MFDQLLCRSEWLKIVSTANDKAEIRNWGLNGLLKVSKIRSIIWSIYLNVIEGGPSDWVLKKREDRRKYQELKVKHNLNPHTLLKTKDNPLSTEKDSPWNKHFCDEQCK